ncbi:VWA domain-containing protein [Paenibacillus nanensis]|uniref:VWA domain-containing protein n=1 Tax=Paenibacillus nanensis TaxID=393251 RepID=A0A3A1UWC9_9BACL|nr:VWA domain-containing protein [Paenibacillus nanensis]RIX51731.1 VWA domain-containing protein [Paenibacillus nanensis]
MGIQADSPWALLLLAPLLVYIWRMARHTPRLQGTRKLAVIATRALILLLLVALIAGVAPYRTLEQRNVVFLADRSASMKDQDAVGEWIAEAWRNKSEGDYGGILSAGLHAVVDRALSEKPLPNERQYEFRTELNDQFTDLSKGLQLGSALLREKGGGRIVLLSDGSENAGDALRGARLLKDAGIAVDVVELASALERDAAIDELQVPTALKQGETFSFQLNIQSTFTGEAEIRLFEDDRPVTTASVHLEAGENRFALQGIAKDSGFHRFRAELFAAGDEQSANNEAFAFSRVSGPPIVLIVEGVPGSSGNIEAALSASLIGHETISPEQLSVELAAYAAYDSIILHNVPATRIAEKPMEWLAKAVGDYGVGLVMLGGEDSYGLGGYFKTPVERALPVYMDLQGRKQIPSLGLVLVIDRSGSMADGKLELAKEAAMRTVELLRDVDTVGVVAFDSTPWWVVEPTPLTNRDEVLQKIQGIQAEGGTEIYMALDAGFKGLLEIDAQRKHMILLTDGQSSTSMNYKTITDAMNENLMTLSTVAVGEGSDQALLQRLANDGKGRYYFTRDQSTLPAIFSRETVLMSRTYIVDGTIAPSVGDAGNWSALFDSGVPRLQAYVATTPKEMAEVALWSPDGDPLLARWTYGAGRSVAWTSDMIGKWAPEWVQWNRFPEALTEWVKWTFPQFDGSPYRISAAMDGGSGKLIVETTGDQYETGSVSGLAAALEEEEGEAAAKRLMPVAPGRYEAQLGEMEPGAYLTQIGSLSAAEGGSAIREGTTAGFVIPYSPEYRIGNQEGSELLAQIASVTGGRKLSVEEAEEAFRFEPVKLKVPYDWSRELLVIALLLWLIDIALRRLSLPWARIAAAVALPFHSLRRTASPNPNARQRADSIGRIKQRTAEKSKFYGQESKHEPPASPKTATTTRSCNAAASVTSPNRTKSGADAVNRQPARAFNEPPSQRTPKRQDAVANEKKDRKPSSGGKPQEDAAQAATINRLLAAKNKTKR